MRNARAIFSGLLLLLFLCAGALGAPLELVHDQELDLHVIRFEGEIKKGSFSQLKKLIAEATAKNPTNQVYLTLNSPGGQLDEAVTAARLLKASGVGTMLLHGASCYSACAYVFLGGYDAVTRQPRRVAFRQSQLGVHKAHLRIDDRAVAGTTQLTNDVLSYVQARVAAILTFLNEMAIPPAIQQLIFDTPSSGMYVLTNEEQRAIDIVRLGTVARRLNAWDAPADLTLPPTVIRQGESVPKSAVDAVLKGVSGDANSGRTTISYIRRRYTKDDKVEMVSIPATWSIDGGPTSKCLDITTAKPGDVFTIRLCSVDKLVGSLIVGEAAINVAPVVGLMMVDAKGKEIIPLSTTGVRYVRHASYVIPWKYEVSFSIPHGPKRSSDILSSTYEMRLVFRPQATEVVVAIPSALARALERLFAPKGSAAATQ